MRNGDKEFDEFINQLQEEIFQEEKCDFSEKMIEEYRNPHNWGEIKDVNAQARGP